MHLDRPRHETRKFTRKRKCALQKHSSSSFPEAHRHGECDMKPGSGLTTTLKIKETSLQSAMRRWSRTSVSSRNSSRNQFFPERRPKYIVPPLNVVADLHSGHHSRPSPPPPAEHVRWRNSLDLRDQKGGDKLLLRLTGKKDLRKKKGTRARAQAGFGMSMIGQI